MRREHFGVVWKGEQLSEQGIVKRSGQLRWLFLGIPQVRPAHVPDEQGIAREYADGIAGRVNDKAHAVRRMARRFQAPDFERPNADRLPVTHGRSWVSCGRTVGNVNGCAGALGQFQVAGDKIGMRMSFEDGDDLELLAFGSFEIVVHVTLGVDDRGLTGVAD